MLTILYTEIPGDALGETSVISQIQKQLLGADL